MTFGANEEPTSSFVDDLKIWTNLNQCGGESPKKEYPYPTSKPNSKVNRDSYGPCENVFLPYG
jgi:hypothetical protein